MLQRGLEPCLSAEFACGIMGVITMNFLGNGWTNFRIANVSLQGAMYNYDTRPSDQDLF